MDAIDKKIIALLEENARIPLKKIAAQVFLSPPAVSARIERLEKKGIITGYRAVLSPETLGYHIMAFINVVLSPDQHEEFCIFVKECPNVTECYHVAGYFSMLIKACFQTTQEMNSFVAQVQRFGKTQTQVVFTSVIERREPSAAI